MEFELDYSLFPVLIKLKLKGDNIMQKIRWGIIFSGLLLIAGLGLCTIFNPSVGIKAESLAIPVDNTRHLVTRIYTPTTVPAPYPVIILCHGVNNSKEMMTPLAVELARHGIAAVAFDFGGYGESYPIPRSQKSPASLEASTLKDTQAILQFLRQEPERYNPQKIGILGHSLGGITALELARRDPQLRSTLLLSMNGLATQTSPGNLWLGVGVYEQLNPASDARQMLNLATDTPCRENQICGDFTTGTARKLVISPTADHISAPYDPQLIASVVNWAQQSFQITGKPSSVIMPQFMLGIMLTFVGGVATGVSVLSRSCEPLATRYLRVIWIRCMTWLMAILIGLIWVMANSEVAPSRNASNNLLLCYCIQICSNYVMQFPRKGWSRFRVLSLYTGLGISAFLIPTVMMGLGELWKTPQLMWQLPRFLLQWPVFTLYNYQLSLKLYLIPSYTLNLQPSLFLIALVLVELVWPGITLMMGERGAGFLIHWLRQPLQWQGVGRISRKNFMLLMGLTLTLIVLISWRLSDGLLNLATVELKSTLAMILLFLLLPVGMIIFTIRSAWFYRWEERLKH